MKKNGVIIGVIIADNRNYSDKHYREVTTDL